MIKIIERRVRQIVRAFEAERRADRAFDRVLAEGNTMSLAQLGREVRYTTRLYRVTWGGSPWQPKDGI